MEALKKKAQYTLQATIIAVSFYLFTTFVFADIADGNVLAATIINIGVIFFFVCLEKVEHYIIAKLRIMAEKQKLNLLKRIFKKYYQGPSVKSSLYLFYIVVLVATAILAADPNVPIPFGSTEYFASVRYGLLILIATDKFMAQIFKDITHDTASNNPPDANAKS